MKKRNKTNNLGITLIALVVTIIVLMILAGVAVAALMGDNGIIKRAGEAKESQRGAAVQDEVSLAIAENAMIDHLNSINGGQENRKTKTDVVNELVTKGYLTDDDENYLETEDEITIGGITIDFTGLYENSSTLTITLSIAGTTVNETVPPNPDSNIFEHTEGTIDTGYVIRDKNNGNEFVWVPVEKDQKITLKVRSPEEITSIKLYDPLGEEISLGTVSGKSYNNSNITPTINGGYKAEVTTASGTESQVLVVRSLYAKDTFLDNYYEDKFTEEYCLSDEIMQIYYRKYHVSNKNTLYQRMNVANDAAFVNRLKNDCLYLANYSDGSTTYFDSVNSNGGFYIARYEAGENGTSVKSNQSPTTHITSSAALQTSNSMYTSNLFTCSLPTGAAWDRTLGWLVNTNNKTLNQIYLDSKEWGHYSDDTFSHTGTLTNTGRFDETCANNIYDLAGNLWEWTLETMESGPVTRGGNYGQEGCMWPSSARAAYWDGFTEAYYGFRPALYLSY